MGPRTPGGVIPGSPMPGSPSQPRSPRGSGVTGDDPGTWRVWWTLNHDRFVDVAAQAPQAATDAGAAGHTAVLSQARQDAYERLAPIVMRVIQQDKNDILLGRALIALAKLGENPRIAGSREVFKLILPFTKSEKVRVAESAAVALGILGHDESIMALSELAQAPQGAAVESRSDRVRAFALYGLGVAARDARREDVRRVAASRLCSIFSAEKGMAVDVKVACLQALSQVNLAPDTQSMGLPGSTPTDIPSASRTAEVEWVLRVLDASGESTAVRAQAATAAARLCADQHESSKLRARVADRLVEVLSQGTRDGLPVRQSAALALGQVGDSDNDPQDVAVRAALTEAILFGSDQATRYFAAMSLAQVASRPGGSLLDPERLAAAADTRKFLRQRLSNGSETDRAWTALSLGVFEYWMRQAGEQPSMDSQLALRSILEATRSPEIAGATCLALGLAGATEAQELLQAQLKSGDGNVRAFASLALGMVGARDAASALANQLGRAATAPEMFVPVSEGLALLGEPAGDLLVKSLTSGLGLESQLAACVALGRTGGGRAVQPLSDLVGDATGTTWVRAMAVEALGSIGDHGATRWNARFGFDTNFLAMPLTSTAPTFDGVLDLE
jgi:HEAT repeat protein